jgi:F-type H+-transporting ATPase subunit epsilon
MAAGNLAINLVTPKGVVAHTDADSVQAPGELGEFELLPGHVPMLTALKPGVLTIGSAGRSSSAVPAGGPRRYAVSSGYLRVDPTGAVEILVEQAQPAKDVDVEAAKNELKSAEAELAKWGDKAQDGEYVNLSQRAGWARARIDAASH